MTIRDEIYDRLAGSTDVTSLVSTRIYRQTLPQDATVPALTFTRVSGPRLHISTGPSGMARGTFQIDCWAVDAGTAEDLAEAVRQRLDGWSATTLNVNNVMLENERDTADWEIGSSGLHRVILDFVVLHTE